MRFRNPIGEARNIREVTNWDAQKFWGSLKWELSENGFRGGDGLLFEIPAP